MQKITDDNIMNWNHGYPKTTIANTDYLFYVDFYKNRLYKISFRGPKKTADYFDTIVKDERDNLVKVIKNAYGEPDYHKTISFFDMDNGYIVWSHIWNLENGKTIKIGISEEDNEFSPGMDIEYAPLAELKKAEEEHKNTEELEDSSNDF